MSGKVTLRAVISSNLAQVDDVCGAARKLLETNDLAECVFTVDLLLREFINNAILHGNRSDATKKVSVEVGIERATVVLSIADEGPGFDWRRRLCRAPNPYDTSGRGLLIGQIYAGSMKFNRAGNRVVLVVEKRLKKLEGGISS